MKNRDLVPEGLQTSTESIVPADQIVCLWLQQDGRFVLAAAPERFDADPERVAAFVRSLLTDFVARNTAK